MAALPRSRRTALVVVLAVASSACGRIHQRSERWVATAGVTAVDPRARLGLEPTRTEHERRFDREIHEGAPYTASIVAFGDTRVDAPLRIRALRLHVGATGRIVELHDDDAPPLEAPLEPASGSHPWLARVQVPLGERLTFVEGEVVSLDAEVTLPWDEDGITLMQSFRGEVLEQSAAKIDAVVGQ